MIYDVNKLAGERVGPRPYDVQYPSGAALYGQRLVPAELADGAGYVHPFKLEVEDVLHNSVLTPSIVVNYGAISCTQILAGEWPHNTDIQPMWGVGTGEGYGYLKGDLFNPLGDVGYSTIAGSTTYGVWLVLETDSDSVTNGINAGDGYADLQVWHMVTGNSKIVVSTTQTSRLARYDETESLPGDIGYYLGTVDVDANGAATVYQHRKSDIVAPVVAVPRTFVLPP